MSVELPPLPNGVQIEYGSPAWMEHEYPSPMFTDAAMRSYARAAVDAALEAVAKARPCCPSCGTHEVSQQQTCHNSACEAYARDVTIYEGWRVQKSSPLASGPVGGD
jgi:hypothetical protein